MALVLSKSSPSQPSLMAGDDMMVSATAVTARYFFFILRSCCCRYGATLPSLPVCIEINNIVVLRWRPTAPRPRLHQHPALFQQVATLVGRLSLAADSMR